MTLLANWQIPNCSIKDYPQENTKRKREQIVCGFLSLSFSHTNEGDHKNEQSLTTAKQIKSSTSLHFAGSYMQLNDDK